MRELIIKRDKIGSTVALWKYLENFHHSIYWDLKPLDTLNLLTNFFPKKVFMGSSAHWGKIHWFDYQDRYTFCNPWESIIWSFLFLFFIMWFVPSEWKHITMTWHLKKFWWWKGQNVLVVSATWDSVTHGRHRLPQIIWQLLGSRFIGLMTCGTFMSMFLVLKNYVNLWRYTHRNSVARNARRLQFNREGKNCFYNFYIFFCTKYLFFLILYSHAQSLLIMQAKIVLWQ